MAIFATQGSGGQPTQWHAERMRALVRAASSLGSLPIFVGTYEQTRAIEALRSDLQVASASLAGTTTIPQLAAILAMSDHVVSIDTGTMHVARAAAVPMLVLAPTYQDPVEWLPLGLDHITVLRGEGIRPAAPGYMLDEIEVPAAVDALKRLYARFLPSEQARNARAAAMLSEVDHLR